MQDVINEWGAAFNQINISACLCRLPKMVRFRFGTSLHTSSCYLCCPSNSCRCNPGAEFCTPCLDPLPPARHLPLLPPALDLPILLRLASPFPLPTPGAHPIRRHRRARGRQPAVLLPAVHLIRPAMPHGRQHHLGAGGDWDGEHVGGCGTGYLPAVVWAVDCGDKPLGVVERLVGTDKPAARGGGFFGGAKG